jgi:hypothetical protein
MPEAERLRLLRIDGEPVAEIDIKACNLTLAHGALGLPAPPEPDPYAIAGLEAARAAVKTWINCTIGKGLPIKAWPQDHRGRMTGLGFPTPGVLEAPILERYAFLRNGLWRIAADFGHLDVHPAKLAIHRLTATEAAIITDVMHQLRQHHVLALPMHDGIIVPASAAAIAHDLLLDAGRRIGKVDLRLTVDGPAVQAAATSEAAA